MKSVAAWRRWFAAAKNETRTRAEILAENGDRWPASPHQSVARFTNLGFAGDLLPVGVQPGVTPEQLADPAQQYRLAGPNGLTCAEMLSDEYRRADDEVINAEIESDPLGFSVLRIQAWGRGNYDSHVIGDPAGRRADIERQFEEGGGISYSVRRQRDGATGVFRGDGIVWDHLPVPATTPVATADSASQINVTESAADASERLFGQSQQRFALNPKLARQTEEARELLARFKKLGLSEDVLQRVRSDLARRLGEFLLA